MNYKAYTDRLKADGNFRYTAALRSTGDEASLLDLSLNDYMGFAADRKLRESFFADPANQCLAMTASSARLLAADLREFERLEARLEELYGRPALLFNSGYHANTGLVSALADSDTVILADKLVHASIIDGIKLSGASFERWRHNDLTHLERLIRKHSSAERLLVIVESVYSMDGDRADIDALIDLKRRYPQVMLYVDEAHAVGATGPRGLGLVAASKSPHEVDVVVGTFGKALASQGAFAVMDGLIRDVAVNRARSFVFSTALPPICVAWTRHVLEHSLQCDEQRVRLAAHGAGLSEKLGLTGHHSHIIPYIIGDAAETVRVSRRLLDDFSIKILPIRTPTVPPGTERLRISLSASLSTEDIDLVASAILSLRDR